MATRNSPQEAEELKMSLEMRYPSRTIRMIDKSGIMVIGRLVAEKKGFEIIEQINDLQVKAYVPEFEVVEVRSCHDCGIEITTIAIGEDGLDECPACYKSRQQRQARESQCRIEESAAKKAEMEWRDRWEES